MVMYRFEGIKFEEMLLYSMASNSKLFGTAMTRSREKQLYKKFLDVIDLPSLGHLDLSLKQDIKFYASFIVIHASKMKKDWVQIDKKFHCTVLRKLSEYFKYQQFISREKAFGKLMKKQEKHPEYFLPGLENSFS
jgi:hypothetical protein